MKPHYYLRLALPLLAVGLSACVSHTEKVARIAEEKYKKEYGDPNCPNQWGLSVVAPRYMEAWVESSAARDDKHWFDIPQGRLAWGLGQTVGWDKGDSPDTAGDPTEIDFHGHEVSVDPSEVDSHGELSDDSLSRGKPMEIYLRWQSLVEPQTYSWTFTVPESMRQAMAKKEWANWEGKTEQFCRRLIVIGVAPGGRTIVWLDGNALSRLEIARGKAKVEPRGPDNGQPGIFMWLMKGGPDQEQPGRHYAHLSDAAKKYVKEHGIPYGSWDH